MGIEGPIDFFQRRASPVGGLANATSLRITTAMEIKTHTQKPAISHSGRTPVPAP